jgi:hypothetical protein
MTNNTPSNHTPTNSHHYVVYDPNSGVGLADDLVDLLNLAMTMADGDGLTDLYLWYLPEPSEYTKFVSQINKFGPVGPNNKPIGIPLYLGTDPYNAALVHENLVG